MLCKSKARKNYKKLGILFKAKTYTTMVILVLVKYLWDAVDMTLDMYIFYQLERGEILDSWIYRNAHVNNSIFAFALLGCFVKTLTWKITRESFDDEETLNAMKYLITVMSFFFEDGPELILE